MRDVCRRAAVVLIVLRRCLRAGTASDDCHVLYIPDSPTLLFPAFTRVWPGQAPYWVIGYHTRGTTGFRAGIDVRGFQKRWEVLLSTYGALR